MPAIRASVCLKRGNHEIRWLAAISLGRALRERANGDGNLHEDRAANVQLPDDRGTTWFARSCRSSRSTWRYGRERYKWNEWRGRRNGSSRSRRRDRTRSSCRRHERLDLGEKQLRRLRYTVGDRHPGISDRAATNGHDGLDATPGDDDRSGIRTGDVAPNRAASRDQSDGGRDGAVEYYSRAGGTCYDIRLLRAGAGSRRRAEPLQRIAANRPDQIRRNRGDEQHGSVDGNRQLGRRHKRSLDHRERLARGSDH